MLTLVKTVVLGVRLATLGRSCGVRECMLLALRIREGEVILVFQHSSTQTGFCDIKRQC